MPATDVLAWFKEPGCLVVGRTGPRNIPKAEDLSHTSGIRAGRWEEIPASWIVQALDSSHIQSNGRKAQHRELHNKRETLTVNLLMQP